MTRALLPFVCSGTIPESLGELTELKVLSLHRNIRASYITCTAFAPVI